MLHLTKHLMFAIAAVAVAFGSAGLARRAPASSSDATVDVAVPTLDAFGLARLLTESPPDTVVLALDQPKKSLRFAKPSALYGATDDALVENAPKLRRLVLLGVDVVRVDKLARRLRKAGRDVRVLAGGLDSWDKTMEQDPAAPAPTANAATWQIYREHVALRHAFGDAALAPVAPVAAPVAPVAGPGGGAPKKREGC